MKAQDFFFEHANYSYDPNTETPQHGRLNTARILAGAEEYAKEHRWRYEWEPDNDADPFDWDGDGAIGQEALGCVLLDSEPSCYDPRGRPTGGAVLASIWSIWDPTPEYRRVIEAELALEAMHEEHARNSAMVI